MSQRPAYPQRSSIDPPPAPPPPPRDNSGRNTLHAQGDESQGLGMTMGRPTHLPKRRHSDAMSTASEPVARTSSSGFKTPFSSNSAFDDSHRRGLTTGSQSLCSEPLGRPAGVNSLRSLDERATSQSTSCSVNLCACMRKNMTRNGLTCAPH